MESYSVCLCVWLRVRPRCSTCQNSPSFLHVSCTVFSSSIDGHLWSGEYASACARVPAFGSRGHTSRTGTAGSHGSSSFNSLRNRHTVSTPEKLECIRPTTVSTAASRIEVAALLQVGGGCSHGPAGRVRAPHPQSKPRRLNCVPLAIRYRTGSDFFQWIHTAPTKGTDVKAEQHSVRGFYLVSPLATALQVWLAGNGASPGPVIVFTLQAAQPRPHCEVTMIAPGAPGGGQ